MQETNPFVNWAILALLRRGDGVIFDATARPDGGGYGRFGRRRSCGVSVRGELIVGALVNGGKARGETERGETSCCLTKTEVI